MLYTNFTEKVLGLKDVILKNFEIIDNVCFIDISMEKRIHKCPRCGTHTSKVHDYRIQEVKHLPLAEYTSVLRIKKRRHVCPCCGKRFFENVSFLPKYQRTTNALWGFALSELTNTCSMKSVAERLNVSQTTIARIIDASGYSCSSLPDTLSIDEFRGNCGGEKFQCILTNPKKKQILDIMPSRNSEDLYRYFSGFKQRNHVKYVVMDLSPLFKSVVKASFPNANIVADKFHAMRLAIYALENVRKEVQKRFHHHRRKYFKRSKNLLVKHRNSLTPEQHDQVTVMLSLSPDLAQAYYLKELVYDLFASKDINTAKKRLSNFKMAAHAVNLPSFNKVSETYTKWETEILNSFSVPFSNGYTEGCNNRIKVLKRTSYGIRNFERFRKRIMHSMRRV